LLEAGINSVLEVVAQKYLPLSTKCFALCTWGSAFKGRHK
jgi:hypothetical protein